jgi:hypothetical protein
MIPPIIGAPSVRAGPPADRRNDGDKLGFAPLDARPAGHSGEAMAALAHVDAERLQHLAHDGLGDESAAMTIHDRRIALDSIDPAIRTAGARSNGIVELVAITFDAASSAGDRP